MILRPGVGIGLMQLHSEVQTAFATQIDVDEGDIGAQLFYSLQCLSDRRGRTDNRDAATLQ